MLEQGFATAATTTNARPLPQGHQGQFIAKLNREFIKAQVK